MGIHLESFEPDQVESLVQNLLRKVSKVQVVDTKWANVVHFCQTSTIYDSKKYTHVEK